MKPIFSSLHCFLKSSKNPLIVIIGPTASGKTALGIQCCEEIGGEVISADSRQIYKYMDIGTNKSTKKEMRGIPHHLIDIISPDERFTVVDFQKHALHVISEIQQRKKIPFVVGGTGLYVDALAYGFQVPKIHEESEFRNECVEYIQKYGHKKLWERLQALDPIAASKIHFHNTHHLIRALEVVEKTGKSKFALADKSKSPFDIFWIGIDISRNILYERINQRVINMFQNGIIEETENLLKRNYSPNLSSMTSIGYKDIADMLKGTISKEEVIQKIQQKTRNYAKRQLTWFRRNPAIQWV